MVGPERVLLSEQSGMTLKIAELVISQGRERKVCDMKRMGKGGSRREKLDLGHSAITAHEKALSSSALNSDTKSSCRIA